MHFFAYVVTEEKPTDAVLAKVMAPFMPDALGNDHKLDWYALGGRYTGLLIPHQMANTIKGSFIGDGPGRTGPGVDALQHSNLKHPYTETRACAAAVVLGGEWYGRDNNDILLDRRPRLPQVREPSWQASTRNSKAASERGLL
jgi:hypothetical protein